MVRVLSTALGELTLASGRRLLGRRRRASWGFFLEIVIAASRGAWAVMPRIGIVRWRNATEALSPLRTDGVPIRFVRFASGRSEIGGAWLDPPRQGNAVLLYFHGGGFVFGSLRSHGPLIGALARAARARTFAPEYRLGPEHPAPAAFEDGLASYQFLLGQGIAPERIVFAGDSAGGTLVLMTLLALRDAGQPLPAAGVVICPWVDLDCSGESFQTNAPFDFVAEEHCRLAALSYLANADPRSPRVSPLFADLSGLPPLLVHAGGAEVLVDQIRDFTTRATAAGVQVTSSVYEDMVHVWHMQRGFTPEAQRAIDEIGAFVRTHAHLQEG